MVKSQEVLSKETRKFRKVKKNFDEEEPTEIKSPMATRRSSRNTAKGKGKTEVKNEVLDTPSVTSSTTKANNKQKSTDSMEVDKEQSASSPQQEVELASTLKNLDIKKKDSNYDSIDEYDSDELIEKVDNYLATKGKKGTTEKTTKRNVKGKATTTTTAESSTTATKRSRTKKPATTTTKPARSIKTPIRIKNRPPTYDHERVQQLIKTHKDEYWSVHPGNSPNMIHRVNQNHPLKLERSLEHSNGPIIGMTLSECGALLATFCSFGSIYIWDCEQDFKLLRKIRDTKETQIEEFYCGLFQGENIVAAGKLKNRHRWCSDDDDNQILPSPIKIFDMISCELVARLEGHDEEILCIKSLTFDNENYYITTSQDGYIIKWKMESDWITLKEKTTMRDGETCMAFTISFLPNTGNKYFLGACDATIKIYDFEQAQVIQVFEDIYTSYCDCAKFIHWLDADEYMENRTKYIDEDAANNNKKYNRKMNNISNNDSKSNKDNNDDNDNDDNDDDDDAKKKGKGKSVESIENTDEDVTMIDVDDDQQYAWFITRGAELCDVDEGVTSTPNSCALHRLIYPKKSGEPFRMEEIRRYKDDDYKANSWLVKIASNGRYLFAPTMNGRIFTFNLLTGQTTANIKAHDEIEVRDILIHPYHSLLFSSADDGTAKVFNLVK